jgi:hypothetical protein
MDVNVMTAARGRVAPIRPAAGSLLSFRPPDHQWLVGPPPLEPSPSDQVRVPVPERCLGSSLSIVSGQNRPRPEAPTLFRDRPRPAPTAATLKRVGTGTKP